MFLIGSLPFSSSWACLQSAACRPAYSPRSGESRTGSILLSHGLAAVVSLVLELTFGIGEPSFTLKPNGGVTMRFMIIVKAIEWVKRCPNPHIEEGVIEIRQMFEAAEI